MKIINNIILALSMALPSTMMAEDCALRIMAVPVQQGEPVSTEISDMLMAQLETALSLNGMVVNGDYSQFFITGKFTNFIKDVTSTVPAKTTVNTLLTLSMGDLASQTIYASQSFELRGVGESDTRAFMMALRKLNRNNKDLTAFATKGKKQIVDYFDRNYKSIISKASRASSLRHYEEALYYITSIPECSKGYAEAAPVTERIFKLYIDYTGKKLLAEAQAAWAASPDSAGAEKAFASLIQIDFESSAYPDAEALAREISKITQRNWDFENREKYNNEIELRRSTIEAARAVGVAYGSHQQPTTTNIMWMR